MDVDTSLSQQSPKRVQMQPLLVTGTPVPRGCHPVLRFPKRCSRGSPHPLTKNFCCRITGHDNLLYPVSITQKSPPP